MKRSLVFIVTILSFSAIRGSVLPHGPLLIQVGKDAVFRWNTTGNSILAVRWGLKSGNDINPLFVYVSIVATPAPSVARASFIGNLTRGHAWFRLSNVVINDTGYYAANIRETGQSESKQLYPVNLTVTETPKFTAKPNALTIIREHKNLFINCSAIGPPAPDVTWMNVSNNMVTVIQGKGTAVLKIPNINRHYNRQKYKCQAENNPNEGPSETSTVIQVNYSPEFALFPKNTTVTQGNNIILECLAVSNPPSNISWEKEKEQIKHVYSMASNGTLTLPNADKYDAGKYTCNASNFYDQQLHVVAAHAYVVVKYQPTIVHNSSKHTVNESDSVTLICKADGYPVPNITWTKSPETATILNSGSTYTIFNASKDDAGTYACTASNGIGSDGKANIEVIVQFKPTINKDASNSSAESWNNNTITLICKFSSSHPLPAWFWYKPSGENITSLAQNIQGGSKIIVKTFESGGDYGLYRCVAANVAGSDEHRIDINQLFPPGPPSFNVTDIKASTASIRWTAPVDNGGSEVNGYKIEVNSKTYEATSSKPNYFPIPSLTKSKMYVVKLSARNLVGYGNASTKTFTTKKEGPPASPEITLSVVSHTSITLSWSQPEENGGVIQYYTIYKKIVGNDTEWSFVGQLQGEPLRFTVKKLLRGQMYSFIVTATNKDGESFKDAYKAKTVTLTIETTTPPTTIPSKRQSSDDDTNPNELIIIVGAVVAVVLIVITAVISIVILRKKNVFGKFGKRKGSSERSAAYHNDAHSNADSLDRGIAVVNLHDDSISTYAAVDMNKKTKKKGQNQIPNYAVVDKSKKKRPGEIIYAELADFNTNNVPAAPHHTPAYSGTDYADITQFQNQNEPEPTYANFSARSRDYDM